jgi:hypothetical protein
MTPELQKYYEARFDMTSSQGWQDLIEDIQILIDNYNDVTKVNSVEDLYKKQGQLDILNWIVSLRDISERAYEELNEETV